jgi:hypothetical protein
MNPESNNGKCWSRLAYAIALLGAFLIVVALVWAMRHYTRPVPLNANRAAERAKALAELNAQNKEALETYGWVDQSKGVVRLTIARAMELELALAQSQGTAAFRTNLVGRVEKATAKPPEKPSQFE